uniref:Phospholipase D-like domain-containing protein n=1 Tax=Phytophthora ramorum TaxID=164328 RepID=H3H1E6_PHYRM
MQDTRPARNVSSVRWFSRDADAEDKVVYYLGLAARPRGSLDICHMSITNDRIGEAILKALEAGCVVRMIVDERSALQKKNMAWIWTVVNNEFILEGTGNYSKAAFNGARHVETFLTTTDQTHVDSTNREFEQLWHEGRVLQWASRRSACVMYLREDEEETKYPSGEQDEDEDATMCYLREEDGDEEEETKMNPPGEQDEDENVVELCPLKALSPFKIVLQPGFVKTDLNHGHGAVRRLRLPPHLWLRRSE